jgi:hypothetical protein
MNDAVALTAEAEPVDLALAFAGSAAREDREVRSIGTFAEATIRIPSAPLGEPVTNLPESTGLLALPPTDATAIQLSVGITESGSGVPSAKKARAEFEALAAAIGPALAKQAQGFAEGALAPAN